MLPKHNHANLANLQPRHGLKPKLGHTSQQPSTSKAVIPRQLNTPQHTTHTHYHVECWMLWLCERRHSEPQPHPTRTACSPTAAWPYYV